MWALSLLAADDPLARPEIAWGAAGLVVALLAGAVAIALAERWRKRAAAPAAGDDTLDSYRELHAQGELTDAEFAELRRKLDEKAKAAPAAAQPPAAAVDPTGRPNLAKFVPPEVLAKRAAAPTAPANDPTEIDRSPPPAALPEPPAPPGTS